MRNPTILMIAILCIVIAFPIIAQTGIIESSAPAPIEASNPAPPEDDGGGGFNFGSLLDFLFDGPIKNWVIGGIFVLLAYIGIDKVIATQVLRKLAIVLDEIGDVAESGADYLSGSGGFEDIRAEAKEAWKYVKGPWIGNTLTAQTAVNALHDRVKNKKAIGRRI